MLFVRVQVIGSLFLFIGSLSQCPSSQREQRKTVKSGILNVRTFSFYLGDFPAVGLCLLPISSKWLLIFQLQFVEVVILFSTSFQLLTNLPTIFKDSRTFSLTKIISYPCKIGLESCFFF